MQACADASAVEVLVGCTGSLGIRHIRFCVTLNTIYLTIILIIVTFEINEGKVYHCTGTEALYRPYIGGVEV